MSRINKKLLIYFLAVVYASFQLIFYKDNPLPKPSTVPTNIPQIVKVNRVIDGDTIEIEGKIKVKDLPKIWNAKMREITGKSPGDEGEGVLQDVHWSSGYFGYFPTYAIGTIYSAQLYNALKKKYKNIEEDLKKGDYKRIINWLRENIHGKGSVSLAEDIIMQCCGEGLNSDSYVRYLTNKYGEIYKFK